MPLSALHYYSEEEAVMFFTDEQNATSGGRKTQQKKPSKFLGLSLMLLAGIFLTLGNSLFQYMELRSSSPRGRISSSVMLIFRCVIQLLFCVAFMLYGKIHVYGKWKRNLLPLIAMGVVEVLVIIFVYEAIQRMPVGDVTVLQFTAPVFTAFLSFICLKSKLSWLDVLLGVASFTGVLFIAKPSLFFPPKISVTKVLQSGAPTINITANTTISPRTVVYTMNYLEGALFAIAAALCLSIFFILNKIYGKVDVILTIFYPSVAGLIIGPIVMILRGEGVSALGEMDALYWGILVIIGFTSFIGLLCLAESLQLVQPVPAILVRNCDVIFVYSFQYLLVHMAPNYSSAIGTVIILSCTTVIALNNVFGLERRLCGERCTASTDDLGEDEDDEIQLQLINNNEGEEDEEEMMR